MFLCNDFTIQCLRICHSEMQIFSEASMNELDVYYLLKMLDNLGEKPITMDAERHKSL